jgi:hypothetical protein
MGVHNIYQGQILLISGCLSTLTFNFDIFSEISQRKQN